MDLSRVIYQIAQESGIPEHHVIDAWSLLRLNPRVKAEDMLSSEGMHPNHKGFALLAQEFYTKMSQSPEFKARQRMAVFGEDTDFNWAVKRALAH